MLHNPATPDARDEDRLRAACDEARARVAADPSDERAASDLTAAVRAFEAAADSDVAQVRPVHPRVRQARQLIAKGELESAEILMREHLKIERNDPPAMHVMGEIAVRCGLEDDAQRIFKRSAELHSTSPDAWYSLGVTLQRLAYETNRPELITEAVRAFDSAMRLNPRFEPALAYLASIFIKTRGMEEARETCERLIALNPNSASSWVNYGYLLKTMGEFGSGVAAYRTAVALDPLIGAAWWGLANLKLAKFFPEDIRRMKDALADPDLDDPNRSEINFTLARALDQAKNYEAAADALAKANDFRWSALSNAPTPERDAIGSTIDLVKEVFTKDFFAAREGWGDPATAPIFIIGLPRAGSTLVEQILASHPAIEGTEELFVVSQLAWELTRKGPPDGASLLRGLSPEEASKLGSDYIELSRRSRRTNRPFFTDKNPYNWRYVGFIHCMLPNARIIDVRRNPMDCCFANYSQQYQVGAHFSYNLSELGRFYSDYVETMRHFDAVLPGRVHRLIHDDLVDDLEGEVRRLLDYVGVSFDERCLRYYETERAIYTPSSEQVRQPINRSGFGRWRNYEPWLGELKDALGTTLHDWRQ